MNTVISVDLDQLGLGMFLAAPLELDYEEPNAVIEEGELEFVVAKDFVKAVEVAVVAPAAPAPVAAEAKKSEVAQRVAA